MHPPPSLSIHCAADLLSCNLQLQAALKYSGNHKTQSEVTCPRMLSLYTTCVSARPSSLLKPSGFSPRLRSGAATLNIHQPLGGGSLYECSEAHVHTFQLSLRPTSSVEHNTH